MPDVVTDHAPNVPTALPLNGEKLYSPAGVAMASRLPGGRGGPHVNASTVWRWIDKGSRAKNGELIRLEAVRAGQRWLTSVEAVGRFLARLTAAALPPFDALPDRPGTTPKQRARAAESASRKADEIFGTSN